MALKTRLRIATSLKNVDAAAWDACANPQIDSDFNALASKTESISQALESPPHPVESTAKSIESDHQREAFNPFITHAFLNALEVSGSVGRGTGWSPAHVLIEDESGTLLATTPAYLKSHSQGEYVFDHGWAQAYERAGGRYYPKLQVSVPFTPATGRRLLARTPEAEIELINGLRELRASTKASGIHITFLEKAAADRLTAAGFLPRTDQQFHFINEGYGSFEDFLNVLSSKKRKNIRRERKDALSAGITIEQLSGADIKEHHWDAFFEFYMDTGARKWGNPYLTRRFFSEIGTAMPQHVLLVLAKRDGRYIAGAINFIGKNALYGRNWGAVEHHPFLHFELCYYQAIDFAISRGLDRVEAGAQGEHKLARGYKPVITYSAHDIADASLRRAVADYLRQERQIVAQNVEILGEHTPFRRNLPEKGSPDERDMYDE